MAQKIDSAFLEIGQHILLPWATQMEQAAAIAHQRLTPKVLAEIVWQIPDLWLEAIPGGQSVEEKKAVYMDFFARRLEASRVFEEEAQRAHSRLV